MRSGFFPLDSLIELPEDSYTPRVKKDLCQAVASDDYRGTAESLAECGNTISHDHVAHVVEKVAAEMHGELFGPDAMVSARAEAAANPPELLVAQLDGSRYRTNEADRVGDDGKAAKSELPDCPSDGTEAAGSPFGEIDARERDRGWREDKVAVIIRAERGFMDGQGKWHPPTEVVKTYVATTADIHQFGRDVRTEVERRGYEHATEVVVVSDNGHGIPEMVGREFSDREVQRVTDFKHSSDRLFATAVAISGGDEVACAGRYHGWKSMLWDGRLDELIAALSEGASTLARRPEKPSALSEGSPARVAWTHVFYFEKWRGTMDYPEYRRRGWPIASSTVESACGQVGERVKHARMRWTRRGAEAVHQVKAAILSQDGRWEQRWPEPIPVLETPDLVAVAVAA